MPPPATRDGALDEQYANVNGTLYFLASSQIDGTTDLWKTNGSTAGTTRVKDVDNFYGMRYLTNVKGVLFFTYGNTTNGRELWKSDGTSIGTVMIKDIRPGSESSYPRSFLAVGNTLYFTANDGQGVELWKSDGTASS